VRFGAPKQHATLLGASVLQRSIDVFKRHPLVSDIVVVLPGGDTPVEGVSCVHGGATRQESVRLGLRRLRESMPDFVLIHDAARPLVLPSLIDALCQKVAEAGAAVPALPITDTVRRIAGDETRTENRDGLYTIQTPQVFDYRAILSLHEKYADRTFTDDAALCEAEGIAVALVPGTRDNIKITHAEDISLAERCLLSRLGDVRTGQGFDVHRFVPRAADKKLILCGIAVPHPLALEGHSDADVALHAVTDALLGALCDGDIGAHFSPADARWKDADSSLFLKAAAEKVLLRGGAISHVDVTIICEAPKIGPHRDAMRARLAEILRMPVSRISVKATTTEGLGFTGRGEGIAAQSIVTVRLPHE